MNSMRNMAVEKPILTISLCGERASRRFERGSKTMTSLTEALVGVIQKEETAKRLSTAIHTAFDVQEMTSIDIQSILQDSIASHIDEVYYDEKPVSWWLHEFASVVDMDQSQPFPHDKYRVTAKACRGYLFYSLQGHLNQDTSGQTEVYHKGESWELLGRPFFRAAPPSQTPEDVRGVADTFLFLAPDLVTCLAESPDKLSELLSWFTIVLEWTVHHRSPGKSLVLEIERTASEAQWSHVHGKCIMLPPSNKRILMASPNVRKAMCDLSEVWLNPTAKSVLLSAWTGSGKEVLADLLINAMGIGGARRFDLSAAALKSAKEVQEEIKNRLEEESNLKEDGNKKERTVIFLDEIHHDVAQEVRSGLLRLMETDIIGWDKHNKAVRLRSPLYILAGSLPPERLRTLPPRDLWTRIEYTIELTHPLRIRGKDNKETPQTRKEADVCVRDYFSFFWFDQVKEWKKPPNQTASVRTALSLLEDNEFVKKLSRKFAKELQAPFKPLVSIRTIRSMVKRLFGKATDEIRRA